MLGLMTTLPIYWPEAESPQELLGGAAQLHWARKALELQFALKPLDVLVGEGGLDDTRLLLLVQPRALAPQENVALDSWVRRGGRLLIFADPMLSGETRYALGDRRRPQDVALLSPILARWGLELAYAEDQPEGLHEVRVDDARLPVVSGGHFRLQPPAGGGESRCRIEAYKLVARCAIGKGQLVAIADATLFETGFETSDSSEALKALVKRAFGPD